MSNNYMIVFFNSKLNEMAFLAHNLGKEEALSDIEQLRKEKLPAFYITQSKEHSSSDLSSCKGCALDFKKRSRELRKRRRNARN